MQSKPISPQGLDKTKCSLPMTLLITAELALALWVIQMFQLEPSRQIGIQIYWLLPLFVIHSLAPVAYRLPLLLLATAVLLVTVAGTTAGLIAIAIGGLLIGLCHLPIAFRWRILAMAPVIILLALLQAGAIYPGRFLRVALPLLGAIFMFRLIVYLYDIRHEKPGSVTIWQRIGYFFLLPAPLFPFFPALDYRAYLRSYYARPAAEISQIGVLWISRGLVHLVLYRVIYHFYSPPAEQVVDLGGVMAYCLSGYLIYLRVSGLFHIITGSLRLFGFDLPHTHRLYFFASGFSDYWRRINIYWKDFMAKIFFFPSFSLLRRTGFGHAARVALATAIVFVATTILHAYQMFWLKGKFEIWETDYWFWGILGLLVIIDNLFEGRRKKKFTSGKADWSTARALWLSLRTTAMFIFLCVLWSLWSSQELSVWFGVMRQAANIDPQHLAILGGFIAIATALGTAGQYICHRGFNLFEENPRLARSIVSTVFPLALLAGLWQQADAVGLRGGFGEKFEVIRTDQPNARDEIQKERSYYESLLAENDDQEDKVVLVKDPRPGDVREWIYRAGVKSKLVWDARWSSNRWGIHDKYYSKRQSPGIYRIALSGASYAMGRGVPDGKNFESVAEDHLNAEDRWLEILNFARSDSSTIQRMADLDLRIVGFEPDAFYLVCHPHEADRNLRKLASLISTGHELTYPYLKDLAREIGMGKGDDETEIIRALTPRRAAITRWTYERMASICKEHDIRPVWIYLPLLRTQTQLSLAEEGEAIAAAAGFHTIILDRAYDNRDPEDLKISKHDYHPNEEGHRLIATRLIEKMKEDRQPLGLPAEIDAITPPSRASHP